MPTNWLGKSSELKLHCFCLFDAYCAVCLKICAVYLFLHVPSVCPPRFWQIRRRRRAVTARRITKYLLPQIFRLWHMPEPVIGLSNVLKDVKSYIVAHSAYIHCCRENRSTHNWCRNTFEKPCIFHNAAEIRQLRRQSQVPKDNFSYRRVLYE